MFGWFKKKSDPRRQEPVPPQKVGSQMQRASRKITEPEFRTLLDAAFKGNAHASVFYAQCAGFQSETLSENNLPDFADKVLNVSPNDFTSSDISRAVDHRLSECFDSLLGEIWDLSLGVISSEQYSQKKFREAGMPEELLKDPAYLPVGKNAALQLSLKDLREKAFKIGARPPYRDYFDDFDIGQIMLDVCMHRQMEDFKHMLSAIDAKFEILRPIFSRLRNSSTNKYGDCDRNPAFNEIDEFLQYTFREDDFDFYHNVKPLARLLLYIEEKLDAQSQGVIPSDGIDFEHWCADRLRLQGWDASVSSASGDQGIDVIVVREDLQVVLQCKRYSKPVGNKAVQEAFTGMKYMGAQHACVIATGGFTKSAREAAAATGVWLLDANELDSFSRYYGFDG